MSIELDKSVVENNRLIAEFMGWVFKQNSVMSMKSGDVEIFDWDVPYPDFSIYNAHHCTELKFHSSWDWLMPVVEKVESLGYGVFISKNACYISKPNQEIVTHCSNWENKITTVFQAVESFIQWYNNIQVSERK